MPYWSNLPFLIFDIRARRQSARMSKIKNGETSMAPNPSNSSNLEQLALKGLTFECWCLTAGMESQPGQSPVACSGWQRRTAAHSPCAEWRVASCCRTLCRSVKVRSKRSRMSDLHGLSVTDPQNLTQCKF